MKNVSKVEKTNVFTVQKQIYRIEAVTWKLKMKKNEKWAFGSLMVKTYHILPAK